MANISGVPKNKRDQKLHLFLSQFGENQDPDIKAYVSGRKQADSLVVGTSTFTVAGVPNTPAFVALPYLNGQWTEDKICFLTKGHVDLFAQKTGVSVTYD